MALSRVKINGWRQGTGDSLSRIGISGWFSEDADTPPPASLIKSWNTVLIASVKSKNGIAIASVKSVNTISNV